MPRDLFQEQTAAQPRDLFAAGGVGDALKNLGSATVRAGTNIVGLPGTMGDLGLRLEKYIASKAGVEPAGAGKSMPLGGLSFPSASDLRGVLSGLGVPEYQPKSRSEDYAGKAMEGVLTVAGTGGLGLPALLGGGLAPITADLAQRKFPEHPILSSVLGGLAGFAAPQALASAGRWAFAPTAQSLTSKALKDVTPADLAKAREAQRLGAAAGAPVTGPEALNNPTLLRYQQRAEVAPQGTPLRNMMSARPEAQRGAVMRTVDDLAPGVQPFEAARDVKAAAGKAIGTAETARTNAAGPFFKAASNEAMPASNLTEVFDTIDDHLRKVGTESQIGRELLAYKGKLQSTLSGEEAAVGPLNAIYKEIRDRISKPKIQPGAFDKEVAGVLKPLNYDLGAAISRGNENIAFGNATYQAMSPAVKELADSPLGILRKSKDITLSRAATTLLDSTNLRPAGVTQAFKAINKADASAAPKLIGSLVDTTWDTASKRAVVRPSDVTPGSKFYTAIAGTPYATANLRAAYNTIPNGQTRWTAFENTLKILDAHSNRYPVGSPTAEKLGVQASLTAGPNTRVLNWLGDFIADVRHGRNMGYLAEVFARSDSVDELARIAKLNPSTSNAASQVGRFLALEGGLTEKTNNPGQ